MSLTLTQLRFSVTALELTEIQYNAHARRAEMRRGSLPGRGCTPPLIPGLSEATRGSFGGFSLQCSRGVQGARAPVSLWGNEETGGQDGSLWCAGGADTNAQVVEAQCH